MARITAENAAEMAARSHIVRRQNLAFAELRGMALPQTPQTPHFVMLDADDPYVAARLVRVRKQLDRLDQLFSSETDPHRMDRLASAQYRLSEQERILAGRPLPGSRRPSKQLESSRGPTSSGPIGLE